MRPRSAVTGPISYLADLGRWTVAGWNRFFFQPADPTPLGVLRIIAGSTAFWALFVYGLDLDLYFGSRGWASADVIREYWADRAPAAWSFWYLIPDAALRPVWVLCLIVTALFTVGLWSRVTAVLTWAIVMSTARRAPYSLYGFDQALSTWVLYLAATFASGQAVSLDRYVERWRKFRAALRTRPKDGPWIPESGVPTPTVSANIGIRLVQLHLCVIYGMAGLAKLQGRAWWEGTAVWGTIAEAEFRRFDFTWTASYPLLLNFLTHGSHALELLYPALIWIPKLRPLLIVSALLMHAGIAFTVGLTEFGLLMAGANLTFASALWLRSLASGRVQPAGKVLYDGACPRCRASMALIEAGDPDHVVEPIDLTAVDVAKIHPSLTKAECMKAMHLVRADGKVEVGYDAVMRLLVWTPLFRIPALVRHIPGVDFVGRRIYRAVADSRPREAVCTDEVCGLHPPATASTGARSR